MSGFGVLAWIPVGAVAGWAVSRLMVTAEDDALRGTAAGMLGAVLGGLAMRQLDAAASSGLNAPLAALAASLWLTWITCVVTSGQQRGTQSPQPATRFARPDIGGYIERGQVMLSYQRARDQLVEQLLKDAMAHEAGRDDEVGRRFDSIERALPRGNGPEFGKLRVALTFWDGWIDARNRGWQADRAITKADWPLLARTIAADLEGDRDVTDARVVTSFDVLTSPPPGNRAQALAIRLRAG